MTRKVLFVGICALALVACKKNTVEPVNLDGVVATGEAIDLTPFSATLIAYYRPHPMMDVKTNGIICSSYEDLRWDENVRLGNHSEADEQREYGWEVLDLKPGTTYYYKAYISFELFGKEQECEGETRSFTTPLLQNAVASETPIVGSTMALMRGSVGDDLKDKDYSVWFKYGRVDVVSGSKIEGGRVDGYRRGNGDFDAVYPELTQGRIYYYQAGATYNEVEYLGEERYFTIESFAPTDGELIDMGLSVKWGSCNVGAAKPEEYGDYFAWGETAPKETYYSDNYSYADLPDVLPLENDAAHVNLGGAWRMPTSQEFNELVSINNSMLELGEYHGVQGCIFISKITGNRIFFPCAGYRMENFTSGDGNNGFYWTSSGNDDKSDYFIIIGGEGAWVANGTAKSHGYSVRGVCE